MSEKPTNTYSSPITQSVIAVNEIVLGSAASTAMAAMYISMAQAAGIGAQNAVSTQNHSNIMGTAALAAGTGNLLWEGINQQVNGLSMADRLNNWQQMRAISTGQPATAETPEQPSAANAQEEGSTAAPPAQTTAS